jgi:hypothetical protein
MQALSSVSAGTAPTGRWIGVPLATRPMHRRQITLFASALISALSPQWHFRVVGKPAISSSSWRILFSVLMGFLSH